MPSIVTNAILQQVPEILAPILAPEKKLAWNKYQIDHFLGYRGRGRLYQAVELPERQPCVIKEYILPKKYFDEKGAKKRLDYFRQRAKIKLAEPKNQDFRLILPTDVILPDTEKDELQQESCYLVTPGELDASDTLTKYLREKGAMTDKQVGQLLNQVLQTLNFLHTQEFRLPSGLVLNGLAHGNLSLDSLLIAPQERGFLIYLCDLELWEGLFVVPSETEPSEIELSETKTDLSSVPSLTDNLIKADLKQLGLVAFYLLAGGTHDYASGQPLDPKVPEQWSNVKSTQLKDFIADLTNGHFTSADNAHQKLIDLLPEAEQDVQTPQTPQRVKEKEEKKSKLFPFLLLGGVLGLLLGLAIGFAIAKSRQKPAIISQFLPCCIKQVADIPSGNFTYTAAWNSTWDYILKQKNLIAYNKILKEELDNRKQPKLRNITYLPELSATTAIAKVSLAKADFAIASLVSLENFQQKFLYAELGEQEAIPDALVVFVSNCGASDKQNSKQNPCSASILKAWETGIRLGTLRRIYQGEITNWRQVGGPNLSVKLYIPTDNEVVKIFEQTVFKSDREIEKFRTFRRRVASREEKSPIIRPFDTFKEIVPNFKKGGIGFAPLSQVLAKCSVYPLGISNEERDDPVFPLIQDNGNPVAPEKLCQGIYLTNVESFIRPVRKYPLAYDLKNLLDTNLSNELRYEKFAYDGLAVFVPFTYTQTKKSLTKALEGQISFEDLRKLYTDVDNKYGKWKDLDDSLPDIPIQLYIPSSEEAVRIFEQRVLKDERSIDAFRRLRQNQESFTDSSPAKIIRRRTSPMLTQILKDLENENNPIGSIGFDTFSKVFGQCSVYPLALSENNSEAVSPLIQDNKPITPETDLCNDKGNYQPNIEAFISQRYPLAYPLVVIYPKDNRRQVSGNNFAYLLRAVEAQRLLKEAGLIPLKAKSVNLD